MSDAEDAALEGAIIMIRRRLALIWPGLRWLSFALLVFWSRSGRLAAVPRTWQQWQWQLC